MAFLETNINPYFLISVYYHIIGHSFVYFFQVCTGALQFTIRLYPNNSLLKRFYSENALQMDTVRQWAKPRSGIPTYQCVGR